MSSFWEFLSGKKTAIAAVLLTISAFLSQVVVGIWHVDAVWVGQAISTLEWVGGLLTGVGLVHKAVKSTKE